MEDLPSSRRVKLNFNVCSVVRLCRIVLQPGFLQCVANGREIPGCGHDLEALAEVINFFSTGIQDGHQDVILSIAFLRQLNDTLTVEHIGDGTCVRHVSAVLVHRGTHIRRGTVTVIGQALDEDRYPAVAITFICNGLPVRATGFLTRTALAGSLDIVIGNRRLFGLFNHVIQRRIR